MTKGTALLAAVCTLAWAFAGSTGCVVVKPVVGTGVAVGKAAGKTVGSAAGAAVGAVAGDSDKPNEGDK